MGHYCINCGDTVEYDSRMEDYCCICADIIHDWRLKLADMSQLELARLYRFTESGHPVFNTGLPLYKDFDKRFKEVGGMTPSISKAIGWG